MYVCTYTYTYINMCLRTIGRDGDESGARREWMDSHVRAVADRPLFVEGRIADRARYLRQHGTGHARSRAAWHTAGRAAIFAARARTGAR